MEIVNIPPVIAMMQHEDVIFLPSFPFHHSSSSAFRTIGESPQIASLASIVSTHGDITDMAVANPSTNSSNTKNLLFSSDDVEHLSSVDDTRPFKYLICLLILNSFYHRNFIGIFCSVSFYLFKMSY
jgi:hypothetical protein